MTSGRGSLQLSKKSLYLARNVTKGNNMLSQSTLMDLSTISPVPPLTAETRETIANEAALPLTAWELLTAVPCSWPFPPCPRDKHINGRSGNRLEWILFSFDPVVGCKNFTPRPCWGTKHACRQGVHVCDPSRT